MEAAVYDLYITVVAEFHCFEMFCLLLQGRRRLAEERRDRAKNDIVLKALSEFSDLEALREEKRYCLHK